MSNRPEAAAVGLVLDLLLGEPPGAVHPVAWFGRAMLAVERVGYRDSRGAGVVHAGVGVGLGVLAGAGVDASARWLGGVAPTAAATAIAVAGRALRGAAASIADALRAGDVEAARDRLPALVGRDPAGLDAAAIARAVVESVAENTVDAVVAPALWAVVAGAAGAWGYRAVNTLDAMVGHRSARYGRFGWASARLDDAAGYLPGRVTAALVAAVRPRSAAAVWRAVRTQAPAHPSPNAGVAEAAFAAALGVRLGGRNRYGERIEVRPALGTGRSPVLADIPAATRLSGDVGLALAAALGVLGVLRGLARSAR